MNILITCVSLAAGAGGPSAPASAAAPPASTVSTLDDVAFMSGTWRGAFQGSTLEEHFSQANGGTMMGVFRWVSEGLTDMTEHLVLEERPDGVHLFFRHFNAGLSPWEQEADGPMHYRLESVEGQRAVFEDSDRVFPRRIIYERTGPDTLVARLEGTRDNGDERQMEFIYRSMSMSTTATDSLTSAGQSIGYDGGVTIAMTVKDLDKSIAFYQDVVGFKLQFKVDDIAWCEFTTSVPHVNIGLSQVEDPRPGSQTPTFGVTDIDHARKILEERGAKFEGETFVIPGMVKLATFHDLDGNPIKLYENLSGQ